MKDFYFIINPKSGTKTKEDIVKTIEKLLPEGSYEIAFTKAANHATELANEAVKLSYKKIIAVGGDGTVNEVGKALVNTKSALGVIPCGSGDGFARHLKIPYDITKAITLLKKGNQITVDTVIANNETYLTAAGVGFEAHIISKFSESEKRGLATYIRLSMLEFLSYKCKNYQLKIDGKATTVNAFTIAVANGSQYGNNAWIAPAADITDGWLDLCIVKQFPKALAPTVLNKLFNKTLEKSNYYEVAKSKVVEISSIKNYHIDGEMKSCDGDLKIEINPKSLNVLC